MSTEITFMAKFSNETYLNRKFLRENLDATL